MRVLWLTENYPPSRGGMAQSCDRIVDGLRGAGRTIDVAHLTRSVAAEWTTIPQQGGLLCTAPLEEDPEHALHRLWTTVRRQHDDLPYTHVVAFGGAHPIHASPVYAAWLSAPLITLLRGNDFDAGVFSIRRRSSLLDGLRASTEVCVVSTNNIERVRALVPDASVTLVANGIDTGSWDALPSEREKAIGWRDEQVPEGRRTIGVIGQLKRKKGALFLLEALASSGLADRFHVVLVGELEPAVTQWLDGERAAASGLSHSTLPFLDRYELLGVLPACDVIALPSFYDGLPNVALEAAALGIPLLSSDAGGLADLVDDAIGFRFSAGDSDSCRTALTALAACDDDSLRARGAAARDRVHTSFTAGHEIDGYLEVLDRTAR